MRQHQQQYDILSTLGDFTIKENWDSFFTIRGSGDSFEWYAEWPQLRAPLLSAIGGGEEGDPHILVPGCGNSRLSEHLYDQGFEDITNIDFSKVAISGMLKRNVRDRPKMKWRVMDMTNMQVSGDIFQMGSWWLFDWIEEGAVNDSEVIYNCALGKCAC